MVWRKLVLLGAALMLAALDASAGGNGGGRGGGGRSQSSGGHHSSGHHHHHGGAVFFGGFYGPYYYYPGYLYSPHPVPVYGPPDPYWYYCRAANAYYPYARECPGGWERYLPSPESPLG
jgi:hypothetical protein